MTALDGVKIRHDFVHVRADFLLGQALSTVELLDQLGVPALNQRVRLALVRLIRAGLVGDVHDAVAVDQGGDDLADERERQLEAGRLLKSAQIDGNDRDVLEARLLERLAQQEDVVAGAAAAAGLRDGEGDLVQIVLAGVQRVDELADDQQRRDAGVVVDVLEAFGHDAGAVVFEDFHVVAVQAEDLLHE